MRAGPNQILNLRNSTYERIPDDDLAPDELRQQHLHVQAQGDEHCEPLEVGRVLDSFDVVNREADEEVHDDDGHDDDEDEEERQREGLVGHVLFLVKEEVHELHLADHHDGGLFISRVWPILILEFDLSPLFCKFEHNSVVNLVKLNEVLSKAEFKLSDL